MRTDFVRHIASVLFLLFTGVFFGNLEHQLGGHDHEVCEDGHHQEEDNCSLCDFEALSADLPSSIQLPFIADEYFLSHTPMPDTPWSEFSQNLSEGRAPPVILS